MPHALYFLLFHDGAAHRRTTQRVSRVKPGLSQVLRSVAAEIAAASREGVEVAVVVGGGNFFRGINAWDGLERATADYMGMLATCMNAICLQVRSNPSQPRECRST